MESDIRHWIKLITEAPIGDIHTHGDFSKPGSLRADDLSLITTKRQDIVKRVLEKAPVLIDLHLVNLPHQIDMDWHLDPVHARDALGFLTPDDMQHHYGIRIEPRPNAVNVVMMQNEGTDRVPLTPWIIAHRIAHIFLYTHRLDVDALGGKFQDVLQSVADEYKSPMGSFYNPWFPALARAFGTTRACREGLIVTGRTFEWLFDCFAQMCVTGTIRFNPAPKEIIDRESAFYVDDDEMPYIDRRFGRLKLLLIERYTAMLNEAVGKLMVF